MPDLQTELSKIAHAWDSHEQSIRNPQPQQENVMTFTKTGNATKDIFEYIKLHGHSYTPMQVTETMVQQGYVASSVSSLITQMKARGLISLDDNGRLYPLMQEFRSLHSLKPIKALTRKGRAKAKDKPTKPAAAGLTALVSDAAGVNVNTITLPSTLGQAPAHVWTAENVLMNIGVAEAAKLYAELGKLFGGK